VSQMLSISLGLPEFSILNQRFENDHYVVEVIKTNPTERCVYCGFNTSTVHDRRTRFIRDWNLFDKPLFLQVHILRLYCRNCGEVFSQPFDSFHSHQHQTHRFRELIYQECEGVTIQRVSQKYHMPYTTVERMYYSVAKEKLKQQSKERCRQAAIEQEVTVLGIDEIAIRKGHTYATVLTDLIHGGVVGMSKNRDVSSVQTYLQHHSVLSVATVHTIVMDMWEPFYKAVKQLNPDARIVIDKYHVIQKVNQALDTVRKQLQPKTPKQKNPFKKQRLLFLKGMEKLDKPQQEKIHSLLEQEETLAQAYFLKESFRSLYQAKDREEAAEGFENWLTEVDSTSFKPFQQVANTIRNWLPEILNYFEIGLTNGRTEGTNHKIKNIKRRAYGYRNLDRFRLRVLLECTGHSHPRPFLEWLKEIS
jgi:transposase